MKPMKVFYSTRQNALSPPGGFSQSAGKPALVVAAWRALGMPMEIVEPQPATLADLCRAHDPAFVREVLACRRANGFGSTCPDIAASLPWTTGSFLSAARHAAATGEPALSPTSGFHHAGWDSGGGFCTFNGLMVAALTLQQESLVGRVAILDLDRHFGDGTRDIIRRLRIDWIQHYTFGAEGIGRNGAGEWLADLPGIVERTIRRCDVVFFQAGADPHIDDPLGGVLTSEQLAIRDRTVFEVCRSRGVAVVVNLAGGYQRPIQKVVDLHSETLTQLWQAHAREIPVAPASVIVRT
ncbi:MAG: histone deacetylase [Gemmatimonadetes bacterium]|nr:histone deacetylase [Gemmatimonadota bacterium]